MTYMNFLDALIHYVKLKVEKYLMAILKCMTNIQCNAEDAITDQILYEHNMQERQTMNVSVATLIWELICSRSKQLKAF